MILATDLDRTLLPNGIQESDNSLEILHKKLTNAHTLVFVTGRNLQLVKDAIKKYKTPIPQYIITDVGTQLYTCIDGNFEKNEEWTQEIEKSVQIWNRDSWEKEIQKIPNIQLQQKENQTKYKISFSYAHASINKDIPKKIKEMFEKYTDIIVIDSIDESENIGLIDIIPAFATKAHGVNFLRKKLKVSKEDVVYCGDSGNDIEPLTYGFKSIVVNNALDTIKKEVLEKHPNPSLAYIAKGKNGNGCYANGILEGLHHFNIL